MRSRPGVGVLAYRRYVLPGALWLIPPLPFSMSSSQQTRSPEAPLEVSAWRDLLVLPEAPLLRLDASGCILDVSAALCGILALTREALIGMPLAAVSGWSLHARASERVRQLLRAGHLRYGHLPLAGGDGMAHEFGYRRIACMADGSQIIECSSDPERRRSDDPGGSAVRATRRGVLDAAGIEQAVEWECARTRASGIALSMLRLNLDRLKLDAGAPVISASGLFAESQAFARRLLDFVRADDFVGQLDDQGFIVLMPATPARGALRAAERLRTAIANSSDGAAGRGATVSIGTVTTRTGRAPYRTLRARADAKCEEASGRGGNRVAT